MTKQNKPLKNADAADLFYRQAQEHLKKQDFAAAQPHLEKSLAEQRTPRALQDLAVCFFSQGQSLKAITILHEAIEADPSWHQPYANLYRIMYQLGNYPEALRNCAIAIEVAPDAPAYKEEFISLAQSVAQIEFSPQIKNAVLAILSGYGDNHQEILNLWLSILGQDPEMRPLHELAFAKDYAQFEKAFSLLKDVKFLLDPFFIYGLKRLLIGEMNFERLVKNLRRAFLEGKDLAFKRSLLPLIAALSEYCFQTEYVMSVSTEEKKLLVGLKAKPDARAVCILGCYEPLYLLSNADKIEEKFSDDESIGSLIKIQITAPRIERELRGTIPSFSNIQNSTSAVVRKQYEEFPYPRWKSLTKMYANELYAAQAFGENHSVLNAGCGTGRHALSYTAQLPNVDMLAIDLSLSSISYAKREAQERRLNNVKFMQGDILEVGKIGRTFDLVQCTGVLHHMADPMAGWRALVDVVKPGGLMRIALYSEIARQKLIATQNLIIEKGYKNDSEGMKDFRDHIHEILPSDIAEEMLKIPDLYSLSQCRDLLFHVQELRFDIPKLQQSLKDLGLQFIGFSLPSDVMMQFSASNMPDPADLDAWAVFERANPDTFRAMYQFWCRKI